MYRSNGTLYTVFPRYCVERGGKGRGVVTILVLPENQDLQLISKEMQCKSFLQRVYHLFSHHKIL